MAGSPPQSPSSRASRRAARSVMRSCRIRVSFAPPRRSSSTYCDRRRGSGRACVSLGGHDAWHDYLASALYPSPPSSVQAPTTLEVFQRTSAAVPCAPSGRAHDATNSPPWCGLRSGRVRLRFFVSERAIQSGKQPARAEDRAPPGARTAGAGRGPQRGSRDGLRPHRSRCGGIRPCFQGERLNARVSSQRSALGRELADALLAELKKAGYSVVFLERQRPIEQTGEDDSRNYSKIATDADAILDVSFAKAGYVEDSSDYVPWILVRVSLISAKTRSRLYSQELSYGTDLLKNGIPHFPSSGTYIYDDFDSLMERAGEAAEGLRVGLPPIAARIGADLR
jgi:hypothetical protein